MADFHILEYDNKSSVSCVFHIPVPAVNNAAGVSYREALVLHLGGATSIHSSISNSIEEASLKSGALMEVSETVVFSSINLTDTQRLQQVKDAYNTRKAALFSDMEQRLLFYGYAGNAV